MAAPRSCSSQPCVASLKSSDWEEPGARNGADAVQVRPPLAVPNTSIRAGRDGRESVTANQARPAETACRIVLLCIGMSNGLAWAGVTTVQVRPPSVVRTGISAAGEGLAGLRVQASAQPSRA